jgi:hypothetical protein
VQFKESAGLFLGGVWLTIGGGVIGVIASMVAAASVETYRYYSSGPNGMAVTFAVMGYLAGLAGVIMVCMAAYRALRRIDAMQVSQPATEPVAAPAS